MRWELCHSSSSSVVDESASIEAEVRQRQGVLLARAQRHPSGTRAGEMRPSPWNHVPPDELLAPYNTIYARGDGKVECGHEPFHSSKSGRCVLIDTAAGRWWCRGCQQHGDALSLVIALHGCSYGEAVRWLVEHYGPSAQKPTRRRRRGIRGAPVWRTL
jgi:hypothetical protein